METNQFAAMSKELFTQIWIAGNPIRGDSAKEGNRLLPTAEETCRNLESLMTPDNKIQGQIVNHRRREMHWIQNEIQDGLAKAQSKPLKKRTAK